jgi:hypothetical protein
LLILALKNLALLPLRNFVSPINEATCLGQDETVAFLCVSRKKYRTGMLRLPLIGRQFSSNPIVLGPYSAGNRASVPVVCPQNGDTNDSASQCGANQAPRDPWLDAIPFLESQTLSLGHRGKLGGFPGNLQTHNCGSSSNHGNKKSFWAPGLPIGKFHPFASCEKIRMV